MNKLLLILVAAGTASFSPALYADDYPSRPITLVAVFGPGSASDTICRLVGQPLGEALKTTVVVENRPGANGALAAMYVARAAPDGYTLLMGTNSPLSAVPFMMKHPSYDAVKDFMPITRMGSFTLMLVVHPSIPAKNVKELIAYAKANPGKLSFASANTSGIVAGETLQHWAGIDMLHVPYKSPPAALQDLIAGRVSMMFTDLTTGLPHVQSGALRALAVTRIHRSSLFPELPTMDEAGVEGFDMDFLGWHRRTRPYPAGDRDETQQYLAAYHRQPGHQNHTCPVWLRGVLQLAERAGRLHQAPTRQMGKNDQGRRHPAGVRQEPDRLFSWRAASARAIPLRQPCI